MVKDKNTIKFRDVEPVILENVYKPSDDTFLLLENLRVEDGEKVLEIGCGCGLVSLVAAKKAEKVVATDINPYAIKTSKCNAEINGLVGKVEFRLGDMFEPIKRDERFDLIVFNPPYLPIPAKDRIGGWLEKAWNGGVDGRKVIDKFISQVGRFLEKKGRVVMVQSTLSNVEKTIEKLVKQGFSVRILGEKHFDFETILCIEAFH